MNNILNSDLLIMNNEENLQTIDYSQKILEIKRVAKATKGSRAVTYRALAIVGNEIDKVGIGIGCADESSFAIKKAFFNAKQNLIVVPITKSESIPCVIKITNASCAVWLSPSRKGSGVIANGPIKTLMTYAGIKNVTVKQFGSNNILKNVRITIFALKLLKEKIKLVKTQSNIASRFYNKLMRI